MMDIYEESQQQKELPPLPTAASLVLTEGGGKGMAVCSVYYIVHNVYCEAKFGGRGG